MRRPGASTTKTAPSEPSNGRKKQTAKANGSRTADQQHIEWAGRRKHEVVAEEGDGNTSRLPRRKMETYSKMWMAQIRQAKKAEVLTL